MVASIGADHVVDYTQQDFTRTGQRYDLMVDIARNRTLPECRRGDRMRRCCYQNDCRNALTFACAEPSVAHAYGAAATCTVLSVGTGDLMACVTTRSCHGWNATGRSTGSNTRRSSHRG
jgi:hypothetical protein